MSHTEHSEEEWSFKQYFFPLSSTKAIHWLIFLGLIVFGNSLFNGFVADDFGQIVGNVAIHSLKNVPSFFQTSTFANGNSISGLYYKPLLLTAYSLIYTIFGQNAFFFHLFQVLIYLLNAVLVFFIFKKFITIPLAFVLAMIFLVHPMNQSVAAYIATLQDTMFFFFGMLALLMATSTKGKYAQIIVFSLLALSLLSKETGIGFVLIHLFYILLFQKERIKNTFVTSFFLLVVFVFLHFLTVGLHFASPQMYHISRIPLQERLLNIPAIMVFYLQTFLFPIHLAVSYDWVITEVSEVHFYLPLTLVIFSLTAVFLLGKKIREKKQSLFLGYLFFMVWFFIGLGFHLQIIPLDGTVATSWFYFPIVGLLGMIGISLQLYTKHTFPPTVHIGIAVVLLIVLSILTIRRNTDFKDNLTLTCHDAKETSNFTLEYSCGNSLLIFAKSYDQAQKHIELSVKLAPYYFANWSALGSVLGTKGVQTNNVSLIQQSEKAFVTSIKNDPSIPSTYELLGYLYLNTHDPQTTKMFLTKAIKRFPTDYKLWLYLAVAEYTLGNRKPAEKALNTAYALSPNKSEIISNWDNLRALQKQKTLQK